ncbi:MAG: hypothetical protein RBT37_00960 [Dissulfurispiraceae bacterium]|jgi:hypothetical protein|nr:hypothetical protein [Dissulfurispiraceae bacterium]
MKKILSLKNNLVLLTAAVIISLCSPGAESSDCTGVAQEYINIIQKQKTEIEALKSELTALKRNSLREQAELQQRVSMLQASLDFASSKQEEKQTLLKQADKGINDNHPRIINLMLQLNKAEEDLKIQMIVNAEKNSEIARLRKELREKDNECEVNKIIKQDSLPPDKEDLDLLNQEIENLEAENLELQNELELLRNLAQKLTEELELLKTKN